MSEIQLINLAIEEFILGIFILYAIYFIFELNANLSNEAKDLKMEIAKLRICNNKFKRYFLVKYLNRHIISVYLNIYSLYITLIILTVFLFYRMENNLLSLFLIVFLVFNVLGNLEIDYNFPTFKAMIFCENIEQLLTQIEYFKWKKEYEFIISAYTILTDKSIELNNSDRNTIIMSILEILP